jgi:putative tryptophan/tyrosine transport system substrate-binding protein
VIDLRDAREIEPAIAAFAADPNGGLVVPPDVFMGANRQHIIAAAAEHRVPAIYQARYFAADGGLMSYGVDYNDLLRRAASYMDRILKGEKPADLPVQAPTKFEFVVNRNAANALGLDVPTAILLRADEVIE